MARERVYVGWQRPREVLRSCTNDLVVVGLLSTPERAHGIQPHGPAQRGGDARGDLDEQAHAVAGGAGAERVAAVVVEERRAEHVDVRPLPPAGEALEEGGGRDRIAVGAPGRVAQVRDLRLEQAVV